MASARVPPPHHLVWSDDPVYTGTATAVVLPELSSHELDDLRQKWIDKYVVPKALQHKVRVTHTDDVLTGDVVDMVARAKELARE